jgi:predicted Fe-Mo cluster-binding NifX family protein
MASSTASTRQPDSPFQEAAMRIAVTSQNFHTVTGHAGKARRFILYAVDGTEMPQETGRLDLPLDMAMHGFDDSQSHPLDSMDVLITAGAGEGFMRRMAERGVRVVTTSETDPSLAAHAFLLGKLTPATNHDHEGCSCHG